MEHSKACRNAAAKYRMDIEDYTAHWPKYCKTCGGWGAISYRDDPSPAGVSLAPGSMDYSDPCSNCVENGVCPRCGEPALDEEGITCSHCHWKFENSETPGAPEEPDCDCYLEDDPKLYHHGW